MYPENLSKHLDTLVTAEKLLLNVKLISEERLAFLAGKSFKLVKLRV